jgi:UDP-N-acetyl-D-mannosaminuronate dehydrogenase
LLSILKEAQAFNLSSILSFADFLARRSTSQVGILGITPQPDNQDLAFSPSLLLAEALIRRGLKVFVHDPYFVFETIHELLPGVQHLAMEDMDRTPLLGPEDAIVLMTPHRFYLEFTQRDIDTKIAGKAGIVIDNTGAWRHLAFSEGTRYHFVGDGTLNVNS